MTGPRAAEKSARKPALFIAAGCLTLALMAACPLAEPPREPMKNTQRQITSAPHGHVLTNANVWSPDGKWIVYDVRPDPEGARFEGQRIERVNVEDGKVEVLYIASNGARCGVATVNPVSGEVVFILGPKNPAPDWQYGPAHRRGVIVKPNQPGVAQNLDARDLVEPFTPGALRGGSHVHVFSRDGKWVSFTYHDALLERFTETSAPHDLDQRNLGIAAPVRQVQVPKTHPRNHDGTYFSALVTRTTNRARPGSDEIERACEEAWVGNNGYVRKDGSRQKRALAFQGAVRGANGEAFVEVFIVDLPEDPTLPGDGPLEGTAHRRPFPPRGVVQRRLTYTEGRPYPGVQGPRHWLRSAPDGSMIAFLMKDDQGLAQIWTVSPRGGQPAQLTNNPWSVASAFTFSPDGKYIAHVMDNSVCVTDAATGKTTRLTNRVPDREAPRPEACVFSPDGAMIAYVRPVPADNGKPTNNQVFVCDFKGKEDIAETAD